MGEPMTEPGTLPEGPKPTRELLRSRAKWYREGCYGLEEVDIYLSDPHGLCEDAANDLDAALDMIETAYAEGAAQERARARAELDEARQLLSPNCAEETLLGAIRNLQQAHLSEKGNAEDAEAKFQQAEVSRRTNARLLDRALAELRAARSAWTAHIRTPPLSEAP